MTSRRPGWGRSATVRLQGNADRRDEDPARERGAATRAETRLGPVEGDREIRLDDWIRGITRREVDRGRSVDRDDRDAERAGTGDQLDGLADRLAEDTGHAGPEK